MIKPGDIITDGTVKWTVRKLGDDTDGNPIGTILAFAGNGALPDGYLLCDGAAVSRTNYADLFAVIGTTYGAGNGSTTFNLPLLTDSRYLRGTLTSGEKQTAGLPQISGAFASVQGTTSQEASGAFGTYITRTYNGMGIGGGLFLDENIYGKNFYASRSSPIYGASSTVRPLNLGTRFIIKY